MRATSQPIRNSKVAQNVENERQWIHHVLLFPLQNLLNVPVQIENKLGC
jgi:hypothetical protein